MKVVITIICTIILTLEFYLLFLKIDGSTDGPEYARLVEEKSRVDKKNMILKAEYLSITSLSNTDKVARGRGFREATFIFY